MTSSAVVQHMVSLVHGIPASEQGVVLYLRAQLGLEVGIPCTEIAGRIPIRIHQYLRAGRKAAVVSWTRREGDRRDGRIAGRIAVPSLCAVECAGQARCV